METYSEKKKLPDFLNDAEKKRFIANLDTHFVRPKLIESKRVWLTYTGLCFTLIRFFKNTSYQLAYPRYSYVLQCIYNLCTKKKKTIEEVCYFVHSTWSMGNYHHWLVDSLPRFKPFLNQAQSRKLVIPKQLFLQPFVQDSLKLLGVENVFILEKNQIAKLGSIEFAELTPGDFTVNGDLKFMVNYLKQKCAINPDSKANRKIFLSRQNIGYRKIENFLDVEKVLSKYNIEMVCAENLTLSEQIQLFSETKILLSVHGAGLTNAVFMPKGSFVLELHPSIEMKNSIFNHIYWNLAEHFELNYFFLGCEPVNRRERFHTANLTVDTYKLATILDKMFASL